MIPVQLDYATPKSLDEAVELLLDQLDVEDVVV